MKTEFPDILENERLKKRLASEILGGTLAHAYLLSGQSGSGRHMLALRIAAALSCENKHRDGIPLPCMTCPSCKKILEGKSPDVIYIRKPADRATMGVESIRFLRDDVLIPPNDTDYKIYIVENAETLTPQAQNAFLLTLEEPPPYVLFLLLCTDPRCLLETVRSRAPTLRTEPIPQEELLTYLAKQEKAKGLSKEELEGVVSTAGGSIGKALELLGSAERKPLMRRRELTMRFLAAKNAEAYLSLIGEFGTKREELTALFSSAECAVRDLLAIKKCERTPLCFYLSEKDAETAAAGFSAAQLSALSRAVVLAKERIERNANVRLTLISLGMEIKLL